MRSRRRVSAKTAKTYGTTGYTECWGYELPQSDQDTQQIEHHTIRRISKKRKKLLQNHLVLNMG